MPIHFAYPNAKTREGHFIGCGRYIALAPENIPPDTDYEPAAPKVVKFAGSVYTAGSYFSGATDISGKKIYERKDRKSEKYFGNSQNLAYLLALLSRSRPLKLEDLRGDIWCTGSISLANSTDPRLNAVLVEGFSIKLRAFLSDENSDPLFLVPAANLESIESELLDSSPARRLSLAECIQTGMPQALYDGKIVLEVLDNELPVLIETLFHTAPTLSPRPPHSPLAPNPYCGLSAFREKDATLFFGRESYIRRLVKAVQTRSFTAVVGPSGSGKSSLVQAGLLPDLHRQRDRHWEVAVLRAGSDPYRELSKAFTRLLQPNLDDRDQTHQQQTLQQQLILRQTTLNRLIACYDHDHPRSDLLLVIDQFEELYTLCHNEQIRRGFLDEVLSALRSSEDTATGIHLAITMRADFLGMASAYRPFADILQDNTFFLGPMNEQELRAAIEKPAELCGVRIEEGLTARIIEAVHSQPGGLPLLEFTLTNLWEKQQYRMLTHAAYDRLGGVEKALAGYAERIYQGLSRSEQAQLEQIFSQLVHPGEGTADTRRIATRAEIGEERWELVRKLADARLVVTGNSKDAGKEQESVEIIHETLLSDWHRLHEWIETGREFRLWQERLRAGLQQWEQSHYDRQALLRGSLLGEAEFWQEHQADRLGPEETRFILSSQHARDKARRQKSRLRVAITLLAGCLSILFMGLGAIALKERHAAQIKAIEALTESSQSLFLTHDELAALLAGIKAGIGAREEDVPLSLKQQSMMNLRRIVYSIRERNRLESRESSVGKIIFSPKTGATLLSLNGSGTLAGWDIQSGEELFRKPKIAEGISAASISPDGKFLALGMQQGTLVLLETTQWREIMELQGHHGPIGSIAFRADSQQLASGGAFDNRILLWEVQSGKKLMTIQTQQDGVSNLAFSPSGAILASGSRTKKTSICFWSIPEGRELMTLKRPHSDIINSIAFSPDGKMLASGSWDTTLKLWRVEDGEELASLDGPPNAVWDTEFSPDGTILASAGDTIVKLWQVSDFSELATLYGHTEEVFDLSFHPSGKLLASSGRDREIRLWDIDRVKENRLRGHRSMVSDIAFYKQGKMLISASHDRTVKFWDCTTRRIVKSITLPQHIWNFSVRPDGAMLAAANQSEIILWDLVHDRQHAILRGHSNIVWGLAFHPKENILASASHDSTIKLWDIQDGHEIATLRGHRDKVWEILFSPDGRWLVSSGWGRDNTIRFWDTGSRQQKRVIRIPGSPYSNSGIALALHPNGKMLASGTNANGVIKLWEFPSGREIATLPGHNTTILSLDFSPDGKLLASSGEDKLIKLWDVESEREIRTLSGHRRHVRRVEFSPDGRWLASASTDGTIKFWKIQDECNFQLDDLLARGCRWLQAYLHYNPNLRDDERGICDSISGKLEKK